MKKIDDEILKYLSGMMNETDKAMFEERLKTSGELAEKYDSAKNILDGFKNTDFDADENYFANILPRFREKTASRASKWQKAIYYLAPALTVILIVVLFYPARSINFESNYRELAEVVVENIDDDKVSEKFLDYINLESGYFALTNSDEFAIGLENSINNIPDSYLSMAYYSSIETFQSLESYSDEELNNLYEGLSEFNF